MGIMLRLYQIEHYAGRPWQVATPIKTVDDLHAVMQTNSLRYFIYSNGRFCRRYVKFAHYIRVISCEVSWEKRRVARHPSNWFLRGRNLKKAAYSAFILTLQGRTRLPETVTIE